MFTAIINFLRSKKFRIALSVGLIIGLLIHWDTQFDQNGPLLIWVISSSLGYIYRIFSDFILQQNYVMLDDALIMGFLFLILPLSSILLTIVFSFVQDKHRIFSIAGIMTIIINSFYLFAHTSFARHRNCSLFIPCQPTNSMELGPLVFISTILIIIVLIGYLLNFTIELFYSKKAIK
ncbi:MAG: hypothetical protein NZM26_03775 [Patescibacteria group bacterium]|nr:hypothetical protein [Patescibacteria group bacterium]